MKQQLRVMKTPLPVQSTKNHMILKKVDPRSLTDKQMLIEERTENYAITNLLNRIIEMTLLDGVKSSKHSTEAFVILPQPCSRFNGISK